MSASRANGEARAIRDVLSVEWLDGLSVTSQAWSGLILGCASKNLKIFSPLAAVLLSGFFSHRNMQLSIPLKSCRVTTETSLSFCNVCSLNELHVRRYVCAKDERF